MGLVNGLTEKQAWELVAAAKRLLEEDGKVATICTTGKQGDIIVKSVMDGTLPYASKISELKAKQAAHTGLSTRSMRDSVANGEITLGVLGIDKNEFIPWAGGVPIYENGVLLGGMGVSNLAEDEDEKYCMEAIKACGLSIVK